MRMKAVPAKHFRLPAGTARESRTVVLGFEVAQEYQYLNGEARSVLIGGLEYGVAGVMAEYQLVPALNTSVYITSASAEADWDDTGEPTQALARVDPDRVQQTLESLPVAISYGGATGIVTDVPSELLAAEAQIDETLRAVVLAMGGLALVVGGLGIANVMSISVLQRSAEIGIRRAIGQSRPLIAGQFLIEALVVGILGGAIGAGVGAGAVAIGADIKDWGVSLSAFLLVGAALLATAVAVIAGLYPAGKAARLEPLETLRLG